MHKPKNINELLKNGGPRLAALKATSEARNLTLEHVRAALSPEMADTIVSAGILKGQLTLGVAGAQWAARLRYVTDTVRLRVASSLEIEILTVRIKVVPPA